MCGLNAHRRDLVYVCAAHNIRTAIHLANRNYLRICYIVAPFIMHNLSSGDNLPRKLYFPFISVCASVREGHNKY